MELEAVMAERRRELQHAIRFYDDRGWDDLRDEYRVRLDELQRLEVFSMPTTPPLTEGEARAMAGDQ